MHSVSVTNFRFEQPLPIGSLGFDCKEGSVGQELFRHGMYSFYRVFTNLGKLTSRKLQFVTLLSFKVMKWIMYSYFGYLVASCN